MKTKKLIKLLQENDPTGETHVRINGEPLIHLELKEGYWDGPYNYLERGEDGEIVWVQSTKNNKIDFYTMDMFDFIDHFDGDLEKVKEHIRIEYDYMDDRSENEFIKMVEKTHKEYVDIEQKIKNNK